MSRGTVHSQFTLPTHTYGLFTKHNVHQVHQCCWKWHKLNFHTKGEDKYFMVSLIGGTLKNLNSQNQIF